MGKLAERQRRRERNTWPLLTCNPSRSVHKTAFLGVISAMLHDSCVRMQMTWAMCCAVIRAGGPLPTPRQASLLYNWPPPQLTGILSTLNGRHLKMGVFPLLSFLLIFGIWERRKQIFIFLIINLLFLVLLNLYNYILTGTCMERSLQSEQDIRTKRRNASVVVGCCGGEGWGRVWEGFLNWITTELNHGCH